MVNKLILTFVAMSAVSLVIGGGQGCRTQKIQAPSTNARPEILATALDPAEERDLQKLLPIALRSLMKWAGLTGCVDANGNAVNVADRISAKEGEEIEMRTDVRENTLVVYLDVIGLYLVFPRLHERGLAPPIDQQFCEKSYQDALAAQKQHPYFEKSKKDVRGDPRLTAIVDQINEKYPTSDYDKVTREESRKYRLSELGSIPVEPTLKWSAEKRRLFDRILEVARREAMLHCSVSKPVRMTIPNFEIGEASIYVLLEAGESQRTVEQIEITRDISDGQYKAEPAKNLALPDEIAPLIHLIKDTEVAQVKVNCN